MQAFKNVLQLIFYLIWIPLGILLFVVVIFLIFNNPLKSLGGGMGGPGEFGQQEQGGPSEEMIKQYMQRGGGQQPSGSQK